MSEAYRSPCAPEEKTKPAGGKAPEGVGRKFGTQTPELLVQHPSCSLKSLTHRHTRSSMELLLLPATAGPGRAGAVLRSLDRQHQPHLGMCEKCTFSGPNSDLPNQKLWQCFPVVSIFW